MLGRRPPVVPSLPTSSISPSSIISPTSFVIVGMLAPSSRLMSAMLSVPSLMNLPRMACFSDALLLSEKFKNEFIPWSVCPIFLDFLESLSGSFRYDSPHNQHVWHAHHGENEESSGLTPFEQHRSKLPDKVCPDPEHESCQ